MSEIIDIFSSLPEEKFEPGYDPKYSGAPLPKGRYEGVVSFAKDDVEPSKQWGQQSGEPTHYGARLKAVVNGSNAFTGRRASTYISTRPFKAGSQTEKLISSATRFLRALDRDRATEAETPVDLARGITTVVGDGIRAVFDVDWKANCKECRQRGVKHSKDTPIAFYKMEDFPKQDDGSYLAEAPCPTCGAVLIADAEFTVKGLL